MNTQPQVYLLPLECRHHKKCAKHYGTIVPPVTMNRPTDFSVTIKWEPVTEEFKVETPETDFIKCEPESDRKCGLDTSTSVTIGVVRIKTEAQDEQLVMNKASLKDNVFDNRTGEDKTEINTHVTNDSRSDILTGDNNNHPTNDEVKRTDEYLNPGIRGGKSFSNGERSKNRVNDSSSSRKEANPPESLTCTGRVKKLSKQAACDTQENRHTGEQHYKCPVCGKSFSDLGACKRHQRIHTGEKSYKCPTCGKSFSQRGTCKRHQQTHTGERPYKCVTCGKAFSRRSHCTRHQISHRDKKPHRYLHCNQSFRLQADFDMHQRLHRGEKQFLCPTCDKSFSRIDAYKRHQRIHTGEKPYLCSTCGKSFTQLWAYTTHARIHSGDKPYKCPVCEKSFADLGNCKAHQRKHTGEKPYLCSSCGKRFRLQTDFKKHQRLHVQA